MNLLPNAAQSAVARIDALNQRFVQTAKNHHAQVSSILSGTKDDTTTTTDKTPITTKKTIEIR